MKTTKQAVNEVPVLMYSGMGPFERIVKTVFYWDNVTPVTLPATADLVAKLIIQSNHEKSNCVVTDRGEMYLTFDTPGYCDGESTVIKML